LISLNDINVAEKSVTLVLTMLLVIAIPALAAPSGFIGGTVVTIDKFSFIADNKTLNAWYINVTDDIKGTLEVAYKSGSFVRREGLELRIVFRTMYSN